MRLPDVLALAFLAIAVLAIIWIGYGKLTSPTELPAEANDQIIINQEPIQKPAVGVPLPIRQYGKNRVIFTALAEYHLSGILVSKRSYSLGLMNYLAPWDYAIVWGAAQHMVRWIKFSQYGRFCYYHFKPSDPVNGTYFQSHMSNNHMIPANKNIRRALRLGKKGESVRVEGYLVSVLVSKKGRVVHTWNSSQIRTDTGNGACEVIYVTRLRLGDKIYE